ncbi:MAG TPA: hypothetical protein VEY30_12505, partial [Myxococcaceae bacterium]|nr:hypothetical protein [Myxococcaceae bacterium]
YKICYRSSDRPDHTPASTYLHPSHHQGEILPCLPRNLLQPPEQEGKEYIVAPGNKDRAPSRGLTNHQY